MPIGLRKEGFRRTHVIWLHNFRVQSNPFKIFFFKNNFHQRPSLSFTFAMVVQSFKLIFIYWALNLSDTLPFINLGSPHRVASNQTQQREIKDAKTQLRAVRGLHVSGWRVSPASLLYPQLPISSFFQHLRCFQVETNEPNGVNESFQYTGVSAKHPHPPSRGNPRGHRQKVPEGMSSLPHS